MRTVLYVDCCIRREQSRTKRLADAFLSALPSDCRVEHLDLMAEDLSYFKDSYFAQREQLLAAGERDHPRFRYAHQFAARFFQGQNLCHCRFYISCVCVAHGLDDNGIRSTHFQTADFNFSCQFSFHSLTFSKFRKRPIYIRRFVSFKSCIF